MQIRERPAVEFKTVKSQVEKVRNDLNPSMYLTVLHPNEPLMDGNARSTGLADESNQLICFEHHWIQNDTSAERIVKRARRLIN